MRSNDTCKEEYDDIADDEIDDDRMIILIENGYSEVEAFAHELEILDRDDKD